MVWDIVILHANLDEVIAQNLHSRNPTRFIFKGINLNSNMYVVGNSNQKCAKKVQLINCSFMISLMFKI